MEEKKKKEDGGSASWELASLSARLLANIIDSVLLLLGTILAFALLWQVAPAPGNIQLAQLVSFVVPVAYHWYFWTRRAGQTPGKFVMSIRVIKANGSAISDTDAVIRAIGYNASAMFLGLGFIWAFIDRNNQGWHDKLARTYVVRSARRRTVRIDA